MADDLSTLSDADLDAAIAAQQNSAVSSAILGQESGNNPDSPSSVDGAVGMGQIMPATFAQYAKPGEDINNPTDNLAVHQRIIADLADKANGDPARIAVGYFSGPGNIAPPDSSTPYKKDHKDGNGKSTSAYVADVLNRMNPVSDAQADEMPAPATAQTADPLASLSDADLDAQIAKLQGASKPSLASAAFQPIKNILPLQQKEANEGLAAMTQPLPSATGHIGMDFLHGVEDPFKRVGGAMQYVTSPMTAGIKSLAADPAKNLGVAAGLSPQTAENWIGRPIGIAGNMLVPAGAEKYAPDIAKGAEDLYDGLKNSSFVQDTSSTSGPFASTAKLAAAKIAPTVDAPTAALVRDAENLGINIPASTFDPGTTSSILTKTGLMNPTDTRAQITTALSKEMGHVGTANLDVPTMEGIQDDIGSKMDDFAQKADAAGGIPVKDSDLEDIADNSFADAPKVNKLVAKIKDRMTVDPKTGQTYLTGDDYQALTQKKGLLSKAMKSSDSDFADTASEIRDHLDSQLQSTVAPSDLADFQKARQQYRTMKIVQPLVESGGVTGQVDSGAKLYNAIAGKQGYGSLKNALQYNPNLGKIAQIANEFPQLLKDAPKVSAVAKLSKAATFPAAAGITVAGAVPAGIAAATAVPIAKGVGSYLSSPFYKEAILKNSGFKTGGVVKSKVMCRNPLEE